MPGMYLKMFASAMAVSFLLAVVLFTLKARARKPAEPEEVPYRKLGRNMILLSIVVIVVLTPLSIDMADRRNPRPDEVTFNGATAVEGFRVAIDYNCMGCHTIVGNGAYYAPDLTYVARKVKEPEAIRGLIRAYAGTKYMPFNLTDRELDALTAWMVYLRDLNTNLWPPMRESGFTFEPSFEANAVRWYESFEAWLVYWLITVAFATFLIYSMLYWYARG